MTFSYGLLCMDAPVFTVNQEVTYVSSVDVGCHLEDLAGVIVDRDGRRERERERERVREICAISITWWRW